MTDLGHQRTQVMILSNLLTMCRVVVEGPALALLCQTLPAGPALQANEIALDAQIAATGVMMLAPVVPVAPVTLGRRSARIPQSAMASRLGLFATDTLLMVAGRIRSFGLLLRSGPLFGPAATESRLATPSWKCLADDPADLVDLLAADYPGQRMVAGKRPCI